MPEQTYFEARERALLGARYDEVYRPQGEVRRALTRNALRCSEARFLQLMGPSVCRAPFCADSFYLLDETARPGKSPLYHAGAYYVQEASAAAPAPLLDVQPGQRVLDMCAAPGGKSAQLAGALGGRGLLVANEYDAARANILKSNLERMGVANAVVLNEAPARIAAALPGWFDRVLVDAPCSGEGMFRRDPGAIAEWTEASNLGCQKRQREILACAARLVRPGGRLVYSTCTFSPLENEDNVEWFLREFAEFSARDFSLPALGRSQNGCLRVYPHRAAGEGHFVALLARAGESQPLSKGLTSPPALPEAGAAFFAALPPGEAVLRGETTCLRSALLPPLDGLRVLRDGLPLFSCKKGVFRPEHAAGMALTARQALELDAQQANAYLGGAPLALGKDTPQGWALARYQGMPLGWGKGSEDTFKNHLPKGLRQNAPLLP